VLAGPAGAGAKTVTIVTYDIPSVKFFSQLAAAQATALGLKPLPAITVAPTETDMASYAGQVLDSGTDAYIPIMGQPQELGLAKALRQQGADLSKKPLYVSGLNQQSPAFMKQVGDTDGLLAVSWAWSPSDKSGPGIEQYLGEMQSAGESTDPDALTIQGVTGWGGVHVAADAMKAGGANTPAALMSALSAGKVPDTTKYGLAPIDFTKPAIPQGPLSKLRLFSSTSSAWKFDASGVPQPLDSEWFSVLKPFDMGAAQ
jgi:ABC-type branched-subunit amino acid transport system substrate-binding protein